MNLDSYPHPLALAWHLVEAETAPFIRLHRVFDAFETLVCYCATITLCSLNTRELDLDTKKDLCEKMERPSLGNWVQLLRLAVKKDRQRFVSELGGKQGFFPKHLASCIGGGESDLVSRRNQVAHGGFLSAKKSQEILDQVEPRVLQLYAAADFFCNYPLMAVSCGQQAASKGLNQELTWYPSQLGDGFYLFPPNAVVSQAPASYLSLFPLQSYRPIFKWAGDAPEEVEPPTCLFYARLHKRHEFSMFR